MPLNVTDKDNRPVKDFKLNADVNTSKGSKQNIESIQSAFYERQRIRFAESGNFEAEKNLKRWRKWNQPNDPTFATNPINCKLSEENIVKLCESPIKHLQILFPEQVECGSGNLGKVTMFNCDNTNIAAKIGNVKNDWKIGRSINHPNFIKLYGHFVDSEPFLFTPKELLLMEYVDGKMLTDLKISSERYPSTMKQMTTALRVLLKNKIATGDVTEENFMLTKKGNLKVIDYGGYDPLENNDYRKLAHQAEACVLLFTRNCLKTCPKNSINKLLNEFIDVTNPNFQKLSGNTTQANRKSIRRYLHLVDQWVEKNFPSSR